jgi:secondary thiamine-phosphate synthase enzyme
MVYGESFSIGTKGFSDILDITGKVQQVIHNSKINAGIVNVFVAGSTASISTIEFEPALVEDMREQLEKFAPRTMKSRHSETWGDDNGFSHIRSTFMGTGLSAPFTDGRLILGTWQQIILIDHDNRPRTREIHVQLVGE